MIATAPLTTGARSAAARLVLGVIAVAAFGALFAHVFRETLAAAARWLGGSGNPTAAAAALPRWGLGAIVASATFIAAEIAHRVRCRRGEQLGLEAIAAAARGEGDGPNARCTLARAGATWLAMAGLTSLGREAAILETGGAVGARAARKLAVPTAHLAIVGVASAFASAYHAPLAAIFYIREHVVPGAGRRDTTFAAAGGLLGYVISVVAFSTKPPFPRGHHPLALAPIALVLVGIVPAYGATRAFFALRHRVQHPGAWLRMHRRATSALAAIAAAVIVAAMPLTSGNGMDLIRRSAVTTTVSITVALLVGKLLATCATLATGTPGGVFSPSLAIAAGAGLATFHLPIVAHAVHDGAARWDAMLALMAVAVVVGTRAPLTAIVVVPELAGDLRLLPLTAAAVGTIVAVDHIASRARGWRPSLQPAPTEPAELDA